MKLTVMQCKNAKPEAKPYKLTDGKGLVLEVMPNGSKFWRKRYRFGGKEKTLSFGPFPDISLEQARLKSSLARADIRNGIDPSAVKQEQKRLLALNASNTFEAIATEWHERMKDTWDKKHGENILSRMKRDLFPTIGNVPIADLKPSDISVVIRKIEDRGAGEMARRALQNCSQVMCYAVQDGRAPHDITSGLKKGFLKRRQKKHYASIEVKEFPVVTPQFRVHAISEDLGGLCA